MGDITLSSSVRNNLLSLQNTASLLGKTQERLSTGLKVNTALDDPAAFFTAAGLNNRASDLNRLLDSVGLSVQTIEAADEGISAITDLVESAQASARQALQAPGPVGPSTAATTTGTVDLGTDVAATTTGSVDLGTDVAATATGSVGSLTGATTLDGLGFSDGDTITLSSTSGGTTTFTVGTAASDDIDDLTAALSANTGATVALSGGNLQVTAANNTETLTFGEGGSGTNLGGIGFTTTPIEATNATIGGFSGTATLTVGSNATTTLDFSTITNRAQLETALGGLAGGTATIDGSNNLVVTASNTTDSIVTGGTADTSLGLGDDATTAASNATIGALTGTATLQIGSNAATTLDFSTITNRAQLTSALGGLAGGTATIDGSNNLVVTASNTSDSIVTGGTADTGLGLGDDATIAPTTGTAVNNTARAAAEAQFNSLRTQIDQLSADASFNGNNLLQGDDLSVIFNSAGSSTLNINGVDFSSTGLGVTEAATDSFQSNTNIEARLTELDTAISTLRTQGSTFGSNLSVVETRQEFTSNLINVLETGAGNLTLADTNLEGANLLALQTRQQLSSVSLSLASQADQAVLRLF